MNDIDQLWQQIWVAVEARDQSGLQTVVSLIRNSQQSMDGAGTDECYAAGYACYMMSSHDFRPEAEHWLMQALIRSPGHLGALLYLAYIALDRGKIEAAARIIFCASISPTCPNPALVDRLAEARVFCLAKMGLWSEALHHIEWFDTRLQQDPHCGIVLINLMKLLDEPSLPPEAQPVLKRIREITTFK